MANIPETDQWEEGVYQFETSDPVQGGPDGIDNRQARQLAARTQFLKRQIGTAQASLSQHVADADPHTQYATRTAMATAISSAVAQLVNSSPATLDTLKELADAIGDDPNFAATMATALGTKAPNDSPTLTGTPKSTTPPAGDNSKRLSTTDWFKAEAATETSAGTAKIATQAQVSAGADDTAFVTAKKLWAWAKQATETVIGLAKVATQAQMLDGTDDTTIVTPKKLRVGFSCAMGGTGYVAFPTWLGGLIVQWGQTPAVFQGQSITIVLPLAYPNAIFHIGATPGITSTATGLSVGTATLAKTSITVWNVSASSGSFASFWFCIGV